MLGKRSPQYAMFDVGNVWPLELKPDSFYAQLARVAGSLFSDEEFGALYCARNGRPSVPPSLLALVLILQTRDGVSDEEAVERTCFDLRWCAVLGRHAGNRMCAKSTLQMFRSQLILHKELSLFLTRSLDEARSQDHLKGSALTAALDTKPILGRGAVEDTYNLLATGILQLARAMARGEKTVLPLFLSRHHLENLSAPSVKGTADIDWSDESARESVLSDLVDQARGLMKAADGADPKIKEAAQLLEQLLLQDIEEHPEGGAKVRRGTVKGRVPSATDPEQRHGRKSASKRFTGSKASVCVDVGTGLILSAEVLPGDCGDASGALALVEAAEANSGVAIEEVLADCAYGGGSTRQEFADAQRKLTAKVPSLPNGPLFSKSAFTIDLPVEGRSLEHANVTCPGGVVAEYVQMEKDGGATFYFDGHCNGCPLRAQCTTSKQGRSIHLHPQEQLLQKARALQASPDGRAKLRKRLGVENALARLAHYGIGQARYIGHVKTRFQLTMAATVANFRRTWRWMAAQGT
jgi:hypothetical protein